MENALAFGRRVMEAAGAKRVAWTGPASTHVQGTCRMGSDPARSVVDANCESHDAKRLFVGDASLVPEDPLGQPLADDHGPRRPPRPAPRRGFEPIPERAGGEGRRLGARESLERKEKNVKAAVLNDYNQALELEDRPEPEITRPNQVRVKIEAAGVCSTDLHAIDGQMGPAGMEVPRVLGHENGGRVDAVGDLVTTVSVGDPVLIYPPHSCGVCVNCRRGLDMHCDHHQFTGLTLDGGFTEYLVVGEREIVPLPPGIDPVDVAPHSDAGITAYHAVKKVAHLLQPGTTTVVLGAGGVGHIGLQLARELGSGTVIAVDPHPDRRKLAEELGADWAIDSESVVDAIWELSTGRGADVVLDFVGTDQTHGDGLGMLALTGTYSMIGFGGTITIPSVALVSQEQALVANLVGSWTDLWEVLQLHAAGKVTLKTETHPLDDVNEVLGRLREGDITGRAVLLPHDNGSA